MTLASPDMITTDPHTGEALTLEALAERYELRCQCVCQRYREGKRGVLLVESLADAHSRRSREAAARRRAGLTTRAKPQPPPTPQELAAGVLATREGRLASRLLRDYASQEHRA